jgi:hypothetical protein
VIVELEDFTFDKKQMVLDGPPVARRFGRRRIGGVNKNPLAVLLQCADLFLVSNLESLKEKRRVAPRAVEIDYLHPEFEVCNVDGDFHGIGSWVPFAATGTPAGFGSCLF